ncbi:mannose-1-phosphate guanylyltransferase/mannose-6-phosphate isomerase [Ramlibacter sp.]|uniref:mannose-1-phosphate guanylyltransferase/mannose-6-phosphate isomerase n=1 Tax=Ramlibacter sp. TaxID=1917967 RepID=UPI002BB04476|nr:mannose-1-phosphate guanylyltransferase/mannose-6-phosphate isomerase [Ramlibacter sp.]HWI80669.1 mannose-1-phosphate guanylyltransferase/mannose-6-phosphate isomerase [Ramlibacter sp.]
MSSSSILPVVLAGGSGTRLWPLSRQLHPKQFLALEGPHTLFQQAVLRLVALAEQGDDLLPACAAGNEEHRFFLRDQLHEIGQDEATVLLEPSGRNTAPAVTLAALHAGSGGDDPVMAITPSDHTFSDHAAFTATLRRAVAAAREGCIALVGIRPDRAETGFGYIRCEGDGLVRTVTAFAEKPDERTARGYLEQGGYFWNGGMFVLRASTWLRAIAAYKPDLLEATRCAWELRRHSDGFVRPDKTAFARIPADSVDYAVLERCPLDAQARFSLKMAVLDSQWSDLGAWDAVWQAGGKDEHGNVSHGDVALHDSHDSLVYATSRLVSTVGLDHIVVVETPDAVLVVDRSRSQDVRQVVQLLAARGRGEGTQPRLVRRPWGWYDSISSGPRFQVKRILVAPKASLSLQMHHHRSEHWIVVSGTAQVTCGDRTWLLTENESTYIPLGQVHRLANPGAIPLEIIEVQSGSYLGEDDIVRFEDTYGRCEAAGLPTGGGGA